MKNTLILLCLLSISSFGFSQDVRFGFTVSPTFGFTNVEPSNNNQVDGISYTEDTDGNVGIVYGALVDFDFTGEDRYFFHSGLTMHHTSMDVETVGEAPGNNATKVNFNYLEIPMTLKLRTNDIGYLRYFGQFGVNNGIKVGDKVEGGAANGTTDIGSYNASLNMGGGVEYTISDDTDLVAGAYYNNGFSNVLDSSAGTVKHNALGIRLGVYF